MELWFLFIQYSAGSFYADIKLLLLFMGGMMNMVKFGIPLLDG
jgi:hypothetical protein